MCVTNTESASTHPADATGLGDSTQLQKQQNAPVTLVDLFVQYFAPLVSNDGLQDPLTVAGFLRSRHVEGNSVGGNTNGGDPTVDGLARELHQFYKVNKSYAIPFLLHAEAIKEHHDCYRDPLTNDVIRTGPFLQKRHDYVVEHIRKIKEFLLSGEHNNNSVARADYIGEKIMTIFGCKHASERHCPHALDRSGNVAGTAEAEIVGTTFDSLDSLNGAMESNPEVLRTSEGTGSPRESEMTLEPRLTSDTASEEELVGIQRNISHSGNDSNRRYPGDHVHTVTPTIHSEGSGAAPSLSSSASTTTDMEEEGGGKLLSPVEGAFRLDESSSSEGDSLEQSIVSLEGFGQQLSVDFSEVERRCSDAEHETVFELTSDAQKENFLLHTPLYVQPYVLNNLASEAQCNMYRHPLTGAVFYTSFFLSKLPSCYGTAQLHCPHGESCQHPCSGETGSEREGNPPADSVFYYTDEEEKRQGPHRVSVAALLNRSHWARSAAGVVVKANTLSEIVNSRRGKHSALSNSKLERPSSSDSVDSLISKPVKVSEYDKFDYLDFAGL
ncbi:hypothetical protein AGDE_15116 [Angomonas deanei]|nr:hypothetical protein AGDE_15116 [Angomonas deanei]|eukprot:EPY19669.1 hypothetical protein AGDE_15116 [Angomonas deanei]